MNYELKYKTFNQLLDEVALDFQKYQLEQLIEPQQLIKIARRVNYDLGLRINMTKEVMLDVEHGKVKLPYDFYLVNYALVCECGTTRQSVVQGTHMEQRKLFTEYKEFPAAVNQCTAPVVNCNTTVQGCTCGCSCDAECTCASSGYTSLCENPIVSTDTINTNQTTTETTSTEIHSCTWTFTDKDIMTGDGATIFIDEVELPWKIPGIAITDASTLNALNRGTFTLVYSSPNYTITATGDYNYGDIWSYHDGGEKDNISPTCTTTITNTTTNTISTVSNVNTDTLQNCVMVSNDPCTKPRIELNCKGEAWELVQIINPAIVNHYTRILPLRLLDNAESIECHCPNLYIHSGITGYIKNGFLYVDLEHTKVYMSYQGGLEDEDGNLLIPDHDGLNDYYEYALKQRILENLMMNDEPVGQKLQLVEQRLRAARNNALSIVNMPNFAEMKQLWKANRQAQYSRYYEMFRANPAFGTASYNNIPLNY